MVVVGFVDVLVVALLVVVTFAELVDDVVVTLADVLKLVALADVVVVFAVVDAPAQPPTILVIPEEPLAMALSFVPQFAPWASHMAIFV